MPRRMLIVGSQPATYDELGIGLSEPLERAAEDTVARLRVLLREWVERLASVTHVGGQRDVSSDSGTDRRDC